MSVSYKDLRRRVQELEARFLSTDPELIISTDDLKNIQRDTLEYFDLNGLSTVTFAGYERVRQLSFSPLQPAGLGAEKKLRDRLYQNLRTLSEELDRAVIRKDDPAPFPHSSSPTPVWLTRERKRSQRARLPNRTVNTSKKTSEPPKPEEHPLDPQGERLGHDQKPIRQQELTDGRLALGKTIDTLYDELKRLKQFARGRRKTEGTLRQEFRDFQLWKEIDASSSLSPTERKKFFQKTWDSHDEPSMMKFIGRIVAYEGNTAYKVWKKYRERAGTKRKRRSQAVPTDRPKLQGS